MEQSFEFQANNRTKSITFLSTCDSVNFHFNILNEFLSKYLNTTNDNKIEIFKLHGNIPQKVFYLANIRDVLFIY